MKKRYSKQKIQEFQIQLMVEQWYQNVQYAVVENQDLLKIKKQNNYYVI